MFYRQRPVSQSFYGWRRLLVPYLVFCIGTFVLFHLYTLPRVGLFECLKNFLLPIAHLGAPKNNPALWFLLSLLLVKAIFNILVSVRIPPMAISLFSALLAIVIYVVNPYLIDNSIETPYYFNNIITGLCFYALGAWLQKLQFNKMLLYVVIAIHVAILVFCFSFVDMFKNDLIQGSYTLWMISSLCGCVIINNILRRLCKTNQRPVVYAPFRLLEYVGRNSMVFYAIHLWIIIALNGYVLPWCGIEASFVRFLITAAACIVILPTANTIFHTKSLCWMIGEKH